ncbi:hypothetical protein [Ferruginibacter sp. HRS2-29]|uniref:hypothetical protein n=1 Tax=Ferruginibacter sp. HRS2-29 TaxID=2487334 RepID=UPI0020CFD98F|nr:hypothetical protein [Ferruginibacter sp. HRS2-29]
MTKEIWEEVIRDGAYAHELDWYAIDNKGHIGMFSAIMNAPIPAKVKQSYDNYIGLKQLINSLPKSTSFVLTTADPRNVSHWTSYAEKGLFAFDFEDVHRLTAKNQYDLIARPVLPLNFGDVNIPAKLLDALVKLDCDFLNGDLKSEIIE